MLKKIRLRREFNVQVNVGKPQVGYRETIKKVGDCEGKYIRQSGGRGQYGHVVIKFEPNPGKGFEFVNAIVGGTVPKEYIKPTQDGLIDALQKGLVAGYPAIDIKATLHDGSYHDVDSSEAAYKIAASMALKEAAKKCDPVILEPIMKIEEMQKSLKLKYHLQKCLVTSPIYVHLLKVEVVTPWNLITSENVQNSFKKRSSKRVELTTN